MLDASRVGKHHVVERAENGVLRHLELPPVAPTGVAGEHGRRLVGTAVRLGRVRRVLRDDPADFRGGSAAAGGDMGLDSEEDAEGGGEGIVEVGAEMSGMGEGMLESGGGG